MGWIMVMLGPLSSSIRIIGWPFSSSINKDGCSLEVEGLAFGTQPASPKGQQALQKMIHAVVLKALLLELHPP